MSKVVVLKQKYPVGTIVQHRNGYMFLKEKGGKWKTLHRYRMESKLGRDLNLGEKVYHINGNREDNMPNNLVAIQFNTTKWVFLKRSRIIHIPKETK